MENQQPPAASPRPAISPPEYPRRKITRRATIIGSVIAVIVMAGIGWLAWDLTHSDSTTASAGGAGGPRTGASGAGGGAGGGGRAGGGPGGPGGRGATTVGVATAERADIPIVIDALGTVVPQATVRVRPQVGGVLQKILFKEGQSVRKGELLATIDPRMFEMAVQQATGQRLRDEATLQAARVTLERYRTLLKQDSIARQEVDTQEALVKQLDAALVISKANEGTAKLNLSYTRIVAPVAGRVGLRVVDVGNVISTGDTNGVALITQVSPIDVEFAIPQDQAVSLQQSAGAFMEAKAFDRTRTNVLDVGVFASLDNQIDTQTGTVRAKARFNNAKLTMFPSQFVNVQLNVRTIKDAVLIPVSALRHGANGDFVFVLKGEDRTVSQRAVKAGVAMADKIQVASGVQAGERVITEGADRLRDGSRVILPGDAGSARGPGGGASGAGGGMRRRGAEEAAGGASGAAPAAAASGAPSEEQGARRRRNRDGAQGEASQGAAADAKPANAAPASGGATEKPTAEQRARMLESVKDDPEALARRKAFLDKIDKGDPEAIARWQQMRQRRSGQQ